MQNNYGLSMEDIQSISQATGIQERNLYTQNVEYISKIYKIDISELNDILERCRGNEEEFER